MRWPNCAEFVYLNKYGRIMSDIWKYSSEHVSDGQICVL